MTDFVLYGTPLSPFVRKAQAALHHVGAEYDFENINIMAMPEWFLEISPAKRIPVLRDKTVGTEGIPGTIPDSSSICLFLENKFDAGLYGATAYESARASWYEEYADTVLAMTTGMELFRPIIFPLFGGQPSDIDRAKKAWTEKLPPIFDYLEASLDGNPHFIGDSLSIADIAVGAQMTQIDLIVGLPDAGKWPTLVKHTETMKASPVFAANLDASNKMVSGILPEKVDLN